MKQIKNQSVSLSDYKELFESSVGQRVLFDLMKCHHILNSTFIAGDPSASAFYEGERSVVLRIMRKTKTDMKKFLKNLDEMQKQNNEEDL